MSTGFGLFLRCLLERIPAAYKPDRVDRAPDQLIHDHGEIHAMANMVLRLR